MLEYSAFGEAGRLECIVGPIEHTVYWICSPSDTAILLLGIETLLVTLLQTVTEFGLRGCRINRLN